MDGPAYITGSKPHGQATSVRAAQSVTAIDPRLAQTLPSSHTP
jgi:hypothetical protein